MADRTGLALIAGGALLLLVLGGKGGGQVTLSNPGSLDPGGIDPGGGTIPHGPMIPQTTPVIFATPAPGAIQNLPSSVAPSAYAAASGQLSPQPTPTPNVYSTPFAAQAAALGVKPGSLAPYSGAVGVRGLPPGASEIVGYVPLSLQAAAQAGVLSDPVAAAAYFQQQAQLAGIAARVSPTASIATRRFYNPPPPPPLPPAYRPPTPASSGRSGPKFL